jgi:hypothetical protein
VRKQFAGGRFKRGSGQATAKIRLVEPDDAQIVRSRVVTQPPEGQFVGRGQHDQRVGGEVPVVDEVGVSEREVERCMCRLTCLRPRR